MKAEAKLAFLFFLTGTFAVAQIAQGTFKHIIIVVQENRSPDNLFGAAAGPNPSCGSEYDFEPGVDIDNGQANDQQGQPNPTCNASTPLALHCDPSHGHIDFNNMYDGVNNHYMDGACGSKFGGNCVGACPQYAYVPRSDVSEYFQIAGNYGFANYTCFKPTRGRAFLPISSFLPAPRPPSLTRTQASIGRGSTRGIR
jgi:phospholipase C